MPNLSRRTVGDLTLCACVILGASVLFIGAADLPPPRFEPMGSAAVPRILGGLLIVLALIVAMQSLRAAPPDEEKPTEVPYRGMMVFGALVVYVAALDLARVPFLIATPLFVMATGLAMSRPNLRNALIFAALGLGVALLLDTVLTRFLYIRIG